MLESGQGNPKKKAIDKSPSQHFSILRLVREGQPGSVSLRRNGSLRQNLWSSRGFLAAVIQDVVICESVQMCALWSIRCWSRIFLINIDAIRLLSSSSREMVIYFLVNRVTFDFSAVRAIVVPCLGYSSVPYLAGVAELITCFLLWLQTLSNGKVGRKRTTITGLNLWMAVGLWAAVLLYLAETFGFPPFIFFCPVQVNP